MADVTISQLSQIAATSNSVVPISQQGTTARATGGSISTTSRPGYVVHTFSSIGSSNFTWNG